MYTESRIRHAADIPALMLRYLQRTLPEASELPLRQRIVYDGSIRRPGSSAWKHFSTTETSHIADVAYSRTTRLHRMPLVTVWETERFDGFTAYTRSRLWNHVPLAQAVTPADTHPDFVAHYLGLLPWTPYAALANPRLRWRECDDHSVEVTVDTGYDEVTALADFRPDGMIGTIELRSRSAAGLGRITFSRYAQIGGVFLPVRAHAYRDLLQPHWQATIRHISFGC
ncbi:MAG TPA: DUF6544 family protein [Mycobacteriales bacterium]|nr:DUF6544 family protein [Mycobacteriales bacterium]